MSDRTLWSFYRSPFKLETGLFFSQTGPYFSVWTVVPIGRTVRSGLFQRSTNKATVQTGPDRGQSNVEEGLGERGEREWGDDNSDNLEIVISDDEDKDDDDDEDNEMADFIIDDEDDDEEID